MEVVFPHEVIFTNNGDVSVADVANSLLANEQIVLAVGRVLEMCIDGLTVEKINIRFRYATTQSPLKEAFSAGILITFQEDLKREVPKMIEAITGIHIDPHYETIVTVIALIIAIYGIERAWELIKARRKGSEKAVITPPQITGNFNTLINIGGDLVGVAPERLASAVERAFLPKQRSFIARTALAFIQPAKREKGAAIVGAGQSIEAATIAAAPSLLEIAIDKNEDEDQQPYEQVEVVIHATDIDHGASGWAGHISHIWPKRLRMKLYPGIPPAQLFGKERITADIVLVSKRKENGEYAPSVFHVIRVYD